MKCIICNTEEPKWVWTDTSGIVEKDKSHDPHH